MDCVHVEQAGPCTGLVPERHVVEQLYAEDIHIIHIIHIIRIHRGLRW